jgi:RNA polymerase sigma-70 factor, ECF subfamily
LELPFLEKKLNCARNFPAPLPHSFIEGAFAEHLLKAVANENDEQAQVEAAQTDPARFEELYEANFDRVYAFVARRTANRELAQDLTSEVFQRALAGLGGFKWQGMPFVAWCIGIARNVVAQHAYRSPAECVLPDLGADDGAERRTMMLQAIDSLPDDQKQVIVRRFFQQRSMREIAQELGRSEGAVKQLQLRALRKLRDFLRSKYE